jgi:transcriptional regulator with GAF, ATPase, and Fis domain
VAEESGSLGSTLSIVEGKRRTSGGVAAQPHLFLVMECARPAVGPPARLCLADLDEVVLGRGGARSVAVDAGAPLRRMVVRVPDPWMSSAHATLSKIFGRWVLEDTNSKNGTILNGEPQKRAFLANGDVIELGHTFFVFRDGLPTASDEPAQLEARLNPTLAGLSTLLPGFGQTLRKLTQVARSEVSVVLSGESGTGKEVVARAVHALSARPGAFVAVNCGALPDTLVETELFGYRKGAFSGAAEDRPGLVRSADKGTLFLDEIGDLPLSSQAAFLRVLQEREVVPVGGTRPVDVDVRLVAATHRDLDALVDEDKFRGDLFARISGIKVTLPPLRERREDLGLLIAALLVKVCGPEAAKVTFQPEAARALLRHRWPMNIRELEKTLAAAVVLAGDNPIDVDHLPPLVAAALTAPPSPPTVEVLEPTGPAMAVPGREDEDSDEERPLGAEDLQRKEELTALLKEHKGNVSQVARIMGKARMQIQRWIKRYRIDAEGFRK